MSRVKNKVKGIREVTKKLNKAVANLKRTSAKGLASAAVYIANEAVKRAPIESGDLKNGVYVDLEGNPIVKGVKRGTDELIRVNASIEGSEKIAEIGFIGRYVVKQHEDLSLRHDRDPRTEGYKVPEFNERTGKRNITAGKTYNMQPGGQAKFLESVLVEEQDRILRCIADKVDLGGGDD